MTEAASQAPAQVPIHYHGAKPLPLNVGPAPVRFMPDTTTLVDVGLVPTLLELREPKSKRLMFARPTPAQLKAFRKEGGAAYE